MKKIGELLRSAREQQNISIKEVSRATRIKPEFLEALEQEQWEKLPELPVLVGFVKSIADTLVISREQAVGSLRRDYPPKTATAAPLTPTHQKVRFGPRIILFAVGLLCITAMMSYLVYQYSRFTQAPTLTVISPVEGELVGGRQVVVRGTTDASATVKINSQPVLVEDNGNFAAEIEVVAETKAIDIRATSRTGRESVISRTIVVSNQN